MSLDPLQSFHRLEEATNRLLNTASSSLRDAVADFNAEPVSVSSLDAFRERVLRVADGLATPAGGELIQMPGVGESRRVS